MAYLSAISPENNSIWRYCSSHSFPAHETPTASSDHLRFSVNRILGLQSDDRATKKTEESNNTVSGQCQYYCCCCCCCFFCFFSFRIVVCCNCWYNAGIGNRNYMSYFSTATFIYLYLYLFINFAVLAVVVVVAFRKLTLFYVALYYHRLH